MEINSSKNLLKSFSDVFNNTIKQKEKREMIVVYGKKSFVSFINMVSSHFIGHLIFLEQGS